MMSLKEPYNYDRGPGERSTRDEHPILPDFNPGMTTGFGYLPEGADGDRLTSRNMLEVLTCLVVYTPHRVCVEQAESTEVVELRNHPRFKTWLGFEERDCTMSHGIVYANSCRIRLERATGSMRRGIPSIYQ